MRIFILLAGISLLAACATTSDVVQTGPDSYLITGSSGSFSSGGELKVDSIKKASAYCKDQGKVIQVTSENQTANVFGSHSHSELQFMCLSENDPALRRTVLVPTAPVQTIHTINENK